jgi:IS5 family transposase
VWGDQAYRGQRAVIRQHAPKARDFTNRRYRHRGVVDEVERAKNRTMSKVRARVEHSIGIIKRVFGFAKVLSRAHKEHPSPARHLRTGQSVHGEPASPALPTGVVCPEPGRNTV